MKIKQSQKSVTIGKQLDCNAPISTQKGTRDVNSASIERQVIRPMKLFAAEISGLIATIPVVNDKRNITNQAKWEGT
jgi:hypothetical protein